MHISEYLKLNTKGHANFDFADVRLDKDNELFIDPSLIELGTDSWSRDAKHIMYSYFDSLYEEFRRGHRNASPSYLYSHAGEQNATKLGYGNGQNGKGKTARGLAMCFEDLAELARVIHTITRPQDASVLVKGFAEDCMSDLLTNILHESLNSFTAMQMAKYKIAPDNKKRFSTWSAETKNWIEVIRPCWQYGNKELLLVPKWVVRKNFLFSVNQYLSLVIAERIRDEKGWHDMSKKDIIANLYKKDKHWRIDNAIEHTMKNPDDLRRYHECIPRRYLFAGGCMSDEILDNTIYTQAVS